jgi:branched-chain amino acid transport system substrate-binding protein
MSVKKIVEEAGVPIFMTVGGDPVIMGGNFGAYTYVFKSPQRSSTAVRKLYGYLKAKGLTKVALFTLDSRGRPRLAGETGPGLTLWPRSHSASDTDMTA